MGRNGNAGDVLPAEAQDMTYEDLSERYKLILGQLEEVKAAIEQEYDKSKRKQLFIRRSELEKSFSNLRFSRLLAYFPRYADSFLAAGRTILDHETIKRINALAVQRVGTPPKEWEQFLSDNGFDLLN
jgi:hypothetical protein